MTNFIMEAALDLLKKSRECGGAIELTEQAIEMLKGLRDGAIPIADIDVKVAAALWLPNYARKILVKSKKEWHFGALAVHLQITDLGRALLRQLESAQ